MLTNAGVEFTTSFLTKSAVLCSLGKLDSFAIGDPETIRDWSHVVDGCQCMWLALQYSQPDDYIVASGAGHTLRQFVGTAYEALGVELL
jgi:GDPmannose 4,6-dehydratase